MGNKRKKEAPPPPPPPPRHDRSYHIAAPPVKTYTCYYCGAKVIVTEEQSHNQNLHSEIFGEGVQDGEHGDEGERGQNGEHREGV